MKKVSIKGYTAISFKAWAVLEKHGIKPRDLPSAKRFGFDGLYDSFNLPKKCFEELEIKRGHRDNPYRLVKKGEK